MCVSSRDTQFPPKKMSFTSHISTHPNPLKHFIYVPKVGNVHLRLLLQAAFVRFRWFAFLYHTVVGACLCVYMACFTCWLLPSSYLPR